MDDQDDYEDSQVSGIEDNTADWAIEVNGLGTGIIIEFNHFTPDGLDHFTTAMTPEAAISFAEQLAAFAIEMQE